MYVVIIVSCSLSTLCGNKDQLRRQPPLSRLGTGTVRVQTVAEFERCWMLAEIIVAPGLADRERANETGEEE